MWIITHSRNAILAVVIITCFISADIRRGFGKFTTVWYKRLLYRNICETIDRVRSDPKTTNVCSTSCMHCVTLAALSAAGHVSYMIVRLGPVLRIGSMYFNNKADKELWARNTDMERFRILISGKHPWFALELGLPAFGCIYFAYLRLTTYSITEANTSRIIEWFAVEWRYRIYCTML